MAEKLSNNEIEDYKKAGEIARKVVDYAKEFVKPGMKLIDIANKIDDKIIELGGEFAFPVNLSLNEIAAHYTPSIDDETKAKGLLTIDLGVSVNGYIADTAFSLDLSENKEFGKMIKLNERILEKTLEKLKQKKGESVVSDVGNVVSNVLDETNEDDKKDMNGNDFVVVKNLSGHSLDKDTIHSGLTISNYKNNNNTSLSNMAFAIEPFLTTGKGEVYEGRDSEIYMLENENKNVRDKDARELLKFIKEHYRTRPFCRRWLEKQGFKKLNFLLRLLVKQGILHNFPVLIEKNKKPVSQAEHTIIISGDEVLVTTK